MKTFILTIGPYSFVLEQCHVAVAIEDALKSAPVVELVAHQNGRVAWRESQLPPPSFSVKESIDEIGIAPKRIFTTPLSRAVFENLNRSSRTTRRVLAPAGRNA